MKVRWTRPFSGHLDAAREYIALDNPQAADSVIRNVLETIDLLSRFPEAGRKSVQRPETRQISVPQTPFIMAYRLRENTVELLALWHHARKWHGQ